MSQFIDLNIRSVPHMKMSEKCSAATIPTKDLCSDETFTYENTFVVQRDGLAIGILYWFEYDLFDSHVSTIDETSHINQAVEIFDTEIKVKIGRNINFKLLYNFGVIKFKYDS